MSKKLHLRKVTRKNLYKGRFKYVLCLKRSHWRTYSAISNRKEVAGIRGWLRSACHGHYMIEQGKNKKKEPVYTKLYLNRPMDVAMIKLTYSDALWRIYEIIPSDPVPSE